jgi:hypothetical protein
VHGLFITFGIDRTKHTWIASGILRARKRKRVARGAMGASTAGSKEILENWDDLGNFFAAIADGLGRGTRKFLAVRESESSTSSLAGEWGGEAVLDEDEWRM